MCLSKPALPVLHLPLAAAQTVEAVFRGLARHGGGVKSLWCCCYAREMSRGGMAACSS